MSLKEMKVALVSRDAEIVKLNAHLLHAQAEGPGAGELAALMAQNEHLNVEVKSLTQQLLQAHTEGMALLLQSLAPKPPTSSTPKIISPLFLSCWQFYGSYLPCIYYLSS
ncbi:hypothetical protein R3W88_026595 [Solanum pinnatisectum]|uniref:Uncharacterized protein n=1 Tax=Solanum pinnatisectum TaxID=50273 RepID=A0AAV9LDQ8_9SOLN|nr:hypothetical protein R3W88_026595 [Solanum pinnatisectum]